MKKQKKSFSILLEESKDEARRKIMRKIPSWNGIEGIELPSSLSIEQCSSEATAIFKASLAKEILKGKPVICDLTCGLGADSWAFSRIARQVISYERSDTLSSATRSNFAKLGISNVELRCEEVSISTVFPECDMFYADPARRDGLGKKVFLLEDCTPDITLLLPVLFTRAKTIMLKLSPMADLTMLTSRLGPIIREMHIVSVKSEVKELLCILSSCTADEPNAESTDKPTIFATDLDENGSDLGTFRFSPHEETISRINICHTPHPGDILLEPKAAIMKTGAFKLLCQRFGIGKIAPTTHLYIAPAGQPTEEFLPFFKIFVISEIREFCGRTIKELGETYPHAEVSAKNLPLSSEELQRKLNSKGGGPYHIFGCSSHSGRLLIVSRKL